MHTRRFLYTAELQQRPRGFQEPWFNDSTWARVPVPLSWELLGHGTPIYVNIPFPFEYRCAFTVRRAAG